MPKGTLLELSDAESCVIVVRGSCAIRGEIKRGQLVSAGTLVIQEADAKPSLDLRVAEALGLMCTQPAKRWTVETLARSVGLSRSVFAKRFVLAMGVAPLRYLSELRLERAANALRSSDASLAELCEAVGYASEFAFSRAFKRRFGVAPSVFRRATPQAGAIAMLRAA